MRVIYCIQRSDATQCLFIGRIESLFFGWREGNHALTKRFQNAQPMIAR